MPVPAVPTNYFLQQANAQVFLSWDIMATATAYSVQRSTDGVTFSTLASPVTNYYLDTTVVVGTNYYYQVASTNGSGNSAYTAAQSIVATISGDLSLGQVRLMAQQRADRVNSTFVTLPEWNAYINQSYFELYDLLVTVYEDYYLAAPITFTTDGVSSQYALPNGINYSGAAPFYKLMGVDCGLAQTPTAWFTLKKFNFIARNKYVFPQVTNTLLGNSNPEYRVTGNSLYLIPTPAGGQFMRIWYVPRLTQLLQDNDILDGISGWSEYVIVDAAIKALQKEESDSDVAILMQQKMTLKQRIEESAMNRDAGQPDTVSDTRRYSGWSGWGGGSAEANNWGW